MFILFFYLYNIMILPKINSERYDFIALTNNHLNDVLEIFSNPEVVKFNNYSLFKNLDDAQALIDMYQKRHDDEIGLRWGIKLKNTDKLIGTIGFNTLNIAEFATIGYDLNFDYWNKGYMTEAIARVVKLGFDEYNLKCIMAEVQIGNIASEKVLLKNNFQFAGSQKIYKIWDNSHYEVNNFVLNKS